VADDHRYGAWVILGLTLGLRPGEVSGLTWNAVDLDAGTVVIHQTMTWLGQTPTLKPSTKTGRARTLDLPPRALDALRWHRKRQVEEKLYLGDRWPLHWQSLVFVTTNGTPISPSNMRRTISMMARDAEISGKVTPYDLRHTATSLLSAAGVGSELLADLLGHTSTRMVERFYRHPTTPTISVAADNIDQALGL
jgi:integrase